MNESVCTAENQSDCTKLCVPEYYCEYNITKEKDTNITKYCNTDYNIFDWEIEKNKCPSEKDCKEDSLCYLECVNANNPFLVWYIIGIVVCSIAAAYRYCDNKGVNPCFLLIYLPLWPFFWGLAVGILILLAVFYCWAEVGIVSQNCVDNLLAMVIGIWCCPCAGEEGRPRKRRNAPNYGLNGGRVERDPEELEMLRSNIQ